MLWLAKVSNSFRGAGRKGAVAVRGFIATVVNVLAQGWRWWQGLSDGAKATYIVGAPTLLGAAVWAVSHVAHPYSASVNHAIAIGSPLPSATKTSARYKLMVYTDGRGISIANLGDPGKTAWKVLAACIFLPTYYKHYWPLDSNFHGVPIRVFGVEMLPAGKQIKFARPLCEGIDSPAGTAVDDMYVVVSFAEQVDLDPAYYEGEFTAEPPSDNHIWHRTSQIFAHRCCWSLLVNAVKQHQAAEAVETPLPAPT